MSTENPKDAAAHTKCPLHLLPPSACRATAWALADGAEKYGPWSWRTAPIRATVYVSAAQRHLLAWMDGEQSAPDSGLHHIAHAIAGLMILLDAEAHGSVIDDRPCR